MANKKIAIIVIWFGNLPLYFPAWLRSAEENPDVDFFLFFDQKVQSDAPNIHITETTLEREVRRAADALHEEVSIHDAYKFCDVRPFFGRIYQEFLKGYDYWGYCDIDLVFGQIRSFLTDDVLAKYDRFYEWGPLSLFRNNERMNHMYDLPGCLYTHEETLRGSVKVTAEEHHGLNRICRVNHIPWYTKVDFADFLLCYSDFVLLGDQKNYPHQVFYWENGRTYRACIAENGEVKTDEYVYIHWQKRKPAPEAGSVENGAFYITSDVISKKEPGKPSAEEILRRCPGRTEQERKAEKNNYLKKKIREFAAAPWPRKKLWMRQKVDFFRQTGTIVQHLERK